jgi:general secretion pathway protein E
MLGLDIGTVIWRPKGCDQCGHSGLRGPHRRVRGDQGRRDRPPLHLQWRRRGDDHAKHAFLKSPTLASAARTMVAKGLTTAEEAIRIARREDVDA